MNLSSIKNVVSSKVGRQLLTVQKHSPALLFGAGVVGVVATVVMSSRATLKVEGVLDEHTTMLKKIKTVEDVNYSDEDRKEDKAKLYAKTTATLLKLYTPAVVIGVTSIACLTGSHYILSKRNAGLMAAYAALEKGFNKYRSRVIQDAGEDKDREYNYGVEVREVVIEEDETGPVVIREKHATGGSPYARFFDSNSQSWDRNSDYNIMFLKAQQNYANEKLGARGHVFLNEIYDALGLERSKEGSVVGWVKDKGGDDYIDFGIFDKAMQVVHYEFFTGREDGVWLDFNVDGVIYDKI